MNLFQYPPIFLLIITMFNFDYCPVVCDLLHDVELSQMVGGDDFWQWIFGNDSNDTEHKQEDHVKEELEYHYGSLFSGLDSVKNFQQELDFHIFNLHDFDKNRKLDGLEMLSMLNRHDGHHHHNLHSFEQNTAVIDLVLRTDDKNNDGFLDYNEFKSAKIKHNLKGL